MAGSDLEGCVGIGVNTNKTDAEHTPENKTEGVEDCSERERCEVVGGQAVSEPVSEKRIGFFCNLPQWLNDDVYVPYTRKSRPRPASATVEGTREPDDFTVGASGSNKHSQEGVLPDVEVQGDINPSVQEETVIADAGDPAVSERVRNRKRGRLIDLHPVEVAEILAMRNARAEKPKVSLNATIGKFLKPKPDDGTS